MPFCQQKDMIDCIKECHRVFQKFTKRVFIINFNLKLPQNSSLIINRIHQGSILDHLNETFFPAIPSNSCVLGFMFRVTFN